MKYLEIEHMKKSFGDTEILKDISLSVNQGEVISIIGPSGSGKSTLLRCATMLETMNGGTLKYLDKVAAHDENGSCVYADKASLKEIKKYFGLVFQNFNLFPHYSVLKNVAEAPMLVNNMSKADAETKAMELLTTLGLENRAELYPCQLSGGQQQRVSIARALALEPKILFFDEPTSALDPELTGEVLKVIKQLAAMKMTMIIVTHEMQFAREVSDRVLFMDEGVIQAQGTPDEVFGSDDERVKSFIGKINNTL